MRSIRSIVPLALSCVLFTACERADAAGSGDKVGCLGDCDEATSMTAPAATDAPALGAVLTTATLTPISAILAAPADFEGKQVVVCGDAVGVCESRGCWVELKGDQPFQSIRVKVADGEIVFPMSCLGTPVTVEGVVEKVVVPLEKHREIAAARAAKAGTAFDPASITEPMVVWQIRGLGAQLSN